MRAACVLATSKWEWNAGIGSAVSVLNVQLLGVVRKSGVASVPGIT